MFHIIQENIFKERNYDMIIETMERLGLDYEICQFVPFVHDIEFTTQRKDVWCWGSVKMAHIARKYGFFPGSMDNENHDFEVYGAMYGDHMLNAGGICMNFTDPLPEDDKWTMFFARPTKDTKVFSGQVFMRHSWDEYVTHCMENNTANIISDETRVLISPLKEIYQEIRCWIVGGKVITISQYKIGTRIIAQNMDHEQDAWDFAQKMADIYQPARAFVIDICRTADGFKVVEVNCINCSGFYDMNFQKVVMALEEEFNEDGKGTRVKMSERLKQQLIKNDCAEHVEEFGDCEGIVEEHLSHNGIEWPEVNVRWESSRLRYGYLPEDLEEVK